MLGDPIGLQQVMLNLVVNAMDAVGEVPESDRSVWIGASRKDGEVMVSVKDSGRGIPAGSFFPRVFESFATTKREGLGLGLSISRSIIQAHGGSLWAENNHDKGATFSLFSRFPSRLPRTTPGKIRCLPRRRICEEKNPPFQ